MYYPERQNSVKIYMFDLILTDFSVKIMQPKFPRELCEGKMVTEIGHNYRSECKILTDFGHNLGRNLSTLSDFGHNVGQKNAFLIAFRKNISHQRKLKFKLCTFNFRAKF